MVPKGLFGRAFLILLVPVILLQIVVTLVFLERHLDGVTREMSATIARELRSFATVVEAQYTDSAIDRTVADLATGIGYHLRYSPGDFIDPQERRPFYRIAARAIIETLQRDVGFPVSVDTERTPKTVHAAIQLSEGVLYAEVPERRLTTRNPHFLLVWMVAVSVFLVVVATLFLRNQIRPLRQLASAAEAFGKGQSTSDFKAAGAEEVRRAATAFLTMRARIERQIAQRTLMLSGVSHDLRTPLTRMRLSLAMLDDRDDAEPMIRDLDEMERMVDGFLAFARGESGETPEPTDLRAMLEDILADEMTMGRVVTLDLPEVDREATTLPLRANAMRRCLRNLIENAAKYGNGEVWVTLRSEARRITVEIEDDGHGVPAEQRDDILRPFTRGDVARNQDKGGGTGLGLSIALDVARAHGGDLILTASEHGGLSVLVTLPR
jgi:two-component system osmolarity sensor histidine kinase EnvZ